MWRQSIILITWITVHTNLKSFGAEVFVLLKQRNLVLVVFNDSKRFFSSNHAVITDIPSASFHARSSANICIAALLIWCLHKSWRRVLPCETPYITVLLSLTWLSALTHCFFPQVRPRTTEDPLIPNFSRRVINVETASNAFCKFRKTPTHLSFWSRYDIIFVL